MTEVQEEGLLAARHLRGDIHEVRAEGRDVAIRILFAQEGKSGRILLALEGFAKKTQKTPEQMIRLAEEEAGRLAISRAPKPSLARRTDPQPFYVIVGISYLR